MIKILVFCTCSYFLIEAENIDKCCCSYQLPSPLLWHSHNPYYLQQLQLPTGCPKWVVFSSSMSLPSSGMLLNAHNSCLVQIPRLFLPFLPSWFWFILFYLVNPLRWTGWIYPSWGHLKPYSSHSYLIKLFCCLQISDTLLTFWYFQSSTISLSNLPGLWQK